MVTRLDIAKARARVALARLSGEVIPAEIRSRAAMDFWDAPRIPRAWDPFADLPGIYANGRDFGAPPPSAGEQSAVQATADDAALVESGVFTLESLAAVKARLARGELADSIHRTWQKALDDSLTQFEVAKQLGIGLAKLRWMLSIGDLFAFVANDEPRFPTWQFTSDPAQPLLPHMSRLVEAFRDSISPASIRGFMTTPHGDTRVEGLVATPIEWLQAGGDVEQLATMLDGILW